MQHLTQKQHTANTHNQEKTSRNIM